MIDKLNTVIKHYQELGELMNKPNAMSDMKTFTKIAQEYSSMEQLVNSSKQYIDNINLLNEYKEILNGNDKELIDLAKEELEPLLSKIEKQEEKLKILLIPKNPNDNKNIILEIRSGTGGDEAALFANDLYRMYTRFAERNNWKIEIMSTNDNEGGGIKEVIISLKGKGAYGQMKFESLE